MNRNEASTWGIAIHSERRLIAVSANNFEITVFNMVAFPPDQQEDTKEFKSILGTDSQCRLVGHEHNVPNIDFSGCGRFIVSCSIDKQCRIWDIQKRKTICQRKFVFLGRGSESWSVAYSLFSSLKGGRY
jgi:WD40 repeat protein